MKKFRTKTIEEIKTQYGTGSYQWDYADNYDSDNSKFGYTLDPDECEEVANMWDDIDHDDTDTDFDYDMNCVYAFMLEEIKTVASSKTYRVKTLDEMGGNFPSNWNVGPMRYLLGKTLSDSSAAQYKRGDYSVDIDGKWTVRSEDITAAPLPVETKKIAEDVQWRFKTKAELIAEYGEDSWRSGPRGNSITTDMDRYLGSILCSSHNAKLDKARDTRSTANMDLIPRWGVVVDMLTTDPMPMAKAAEPEPKKDTRKWRYKTERELENQYGSGWKTSQEETWRGDMDHLFGNTISSSCHSEIREAIEDGETGDVDIDDEHCVCLGHITSDPMPIELPKPKRIEEIVTVDIKPSPATDWDEIHRRMLLSAGIPGHIHSIAKEPSKTGEFRINVKSKRKTLRSKIFSKMTNEEQ